MKLIPKKLPEYIFKITIIQSGLSGSTWEGQGGKSKKSWKNLTTILLKYKKPIIKSLQEGVFHIGLIKFIYNSVAGKKAWNNATKEKKDFVQAMFKALLKNKKTIIEKLNE